MGDERLQKRERLRLRSDFDRVFGRRCRAGNGILTVYVAPNGLQCSRLGLSVGRRVGGAVKRSYVRRRIREAFRRLKDRLPVGLDIVCVAQPKAGQYGCDVVSSLRLLVVKAARELRGDSTT